MQHVLAEVQAHSRQDIRLDFDGVDVKLAQQRIVLVCGLNPLLQLRIPQHNRLPSVWSRFRAVLSSLILFKVLLALLLLAIPTLIMLPKTNSLLQWILIKRHRFSYPIILYQILKSKELLVQQLLASLLFLHRSQLLP